MKTHLIPTSLPILKLGLVLLCFGALTPEVEQVFGAEGFNSGGQNIDIPNRGSRGPGQPEDDDAEIQLPDEPNAGVVFAPTENFTIPPQQLSGGCDAAIQGNVTLDDLQSAIANASDVNEDRIITLCLLAGTDVRNNECGVHADPVFINRSAFHLKGPNSGGVATINGRLVIKRHYSDENSEVFYEDISVTDLSINTLANDAIRVDGGVRINELTHLDISSGNRGIRIRDNAVVDEIGQINLRVTNTRLDLQDVIIGIAVNGTSGDGSGAFVKQISYVNLEVDSHNPLKKVRAIRVGNTASIEGLSEEEQDNVPTTLIDLVFQLNAQFTDIHAGRQIGVEMRGKSLVSLFMGSIAFGAGATDTLCRSFGDQGQIAEDGDLLNCLNEL